MEFQKSENKLNGCSLVGGTKMAPLRLERRVPFVRLFRFWISKSSANVCFLC